MLFRREHRAQPDCEIQTSKEASIQFLCQPEDYGLLAEPVPAKLALPEWFRRIPAVDRSVLSATNNGLTVKRCMPRQAIWFFYSKMQFSGGAGLVNLDRLHGFNALVNQEPRHVQHLNKKCFRAPRSSCGAHRFICKGAGEAGMGNVPISRIPVGPANAGGTNNVMVDPSGIGNAFRMAQLPPPRITVPAIPHFK